MGPPKMAAVAAVAAPAKLVVSPLAMSWWNNPNILAFDPMPQVAQPRGLYRFTSPPGLRGLTIRAHGKVRVTVEGKELASTDRQSFKVAQPSAGCVPVWIEVVHERGAYGGAAFEGEILLDCGPGRIAPGDWSKIDGLTCYSGGAWYRKDVEIPAAKQVILDLGNVVSSAEVRLNGQKVGVRVTAPWTFDVTRFVKPGTNRLEVMVCNTLANHYLTIPTAYRGDPTAGLLGPVRLMISK
jgi:hypothetical protein